MFQKKKKKKDSLYLKKANIQTNQKTNKQKNSNILSAIQLYIHIISFQFEY